MNDPLRAVAAIAAAGVILVSTGCGGSGNRVEQPAPNGGLAFSRCMRSHGVSQFPDPESSGAIPKVTLQYLGVSASRFQSAQTACRSLLRPSTAQVRQTLSGMLDFAHCMRAQGVRTWPDPSTDRDGRAVFDLAGRIDPDTSSMDTATSRCAHLLHPAPGQDGTVLCNGIGEAGCHHYG